MLQVLAGTAQKPAYPHWFEVFDVFKDGALKSRLESRVWLEEGGAVGRLERGWHWREPGSGM